MRVKGIEACILDPQLLAAFELNKDIWVDRGPGDRCWQVRMMAEGKVEGFPMQESTCERGSLGLEDLQGAFPFFASVGTEEIKVARMGTDLSEEVCGTVELFAIEKLILDQAMNGFNVALRGITLGRNEAVIGAQGADGRGQ